MENFKAADFAPSWALGESPRPAVATAEQLRKLKAWEAEIAAAELVEAERIVTEAARRRAPSTAEIDQAAADLRRLRGRGRVDVWEVKRIGAQKPRARRGRGAPAGRPMSVTEIRALQAEAKRDGRGRLAEALQATLDRVEGRSAAGPLERFHQTAARLTVSSR